MAELIITRKGVRHISPVDIETFEEFKNCALWINVGGYVVRYNKQTGRQEYLHRVILKLKKGDGAIVDHINGNRMDNRKENLRICNFAENLKNTRTHKDNKSGFKGVTKTRNGYVAVIMANGKRFSLGTYTTAIEAAKSYNEKANELHGEYAKLNMFIIAA